MEFAGFTSEATPALLPTAQSLSHYSPGIFTQNERQIDSPSRRTCEGHSSTPQNLTDSFLVEPARYNRKRKKEKNRYVNGYLSFEDDTILSKRKPRRNSSENALCTNSLTEISTTDENTLKKLGWIKILRSHCGLNHFCLDGGEMLQHLRSNPLLLKEDFNVVWAAMQSEGWDKVLVQEPVVEGESLVRYYYEYYYSRVPPHGRDWGAHRFCSQEAVLNYIARFPYALQTEEEFVKTLRRHEWPVWEAADGVLTTMIPDTDYRMNCTEARCHLWEQPESLFASYCIKSDTGGCRVTLKVFYDALFLSYDLAILKEYVVPVEEELTETDDSDVYFRGDDGDEDASQSASEDDALSDLEGGEEGSTQDSNSKSTEEGYSEDDVNAPHLFSVGKNIRVNKAYMQLSELLDERLPLDWDEDDHGVLVWSLLEQQGWRRQRKDEYSSEFIIAPWVMRKEGEKDADLCSLVPGLDYFATDQDEDILFAMLTSWFEGKRDVNLVLRLGIDSLDKPHRVLSVWANLHIEREKICAAVIAQVKDIVLDKGSKMTIHDLLPYMLQLGWEVKYGKSPSRMDEIVEFEEDRLLHFSGALLPPWTIFGFQFSDKTFYKPAERPINLESIVHNVNYFGWDDLGWSAILKDVMLGGVETLLFPTCLRLTCEEHEANSTWPSQHASCRNRLSPVANDTSSRSRKKGSTASSCYGSSDY